MQNNGTLYLDTFLVKDGAPLSPQQAGFNPENVYHYRKREFGSMLLSLVTIEMLTTPHTALMQYQKLKRVRTVKSLLGADADHEAESDEEAKAKDQAMPIIA